MLKKSNIQPQPPNGSETIVVVRSANPGSIVERLITFAKSVSAAILIARRSFVATLARAWETHRQFVVATLARAWEIPARIHRLATVATFNQQSWSQSSETGAVQLSNGRQAARFTFELAKRRDLRPAFTLIELLVVMGLIGFLASMLTYALLGAQADARVARTRGTITKLNDVILAQWEEYRYRPVDMRLDSATGPLNARDQAHLRMLILRDTMRMEMPDRVTDLLFAPSQYTNIGNTVFLADRAYPSNYGLLRTTLLQSLKRSTHLALLGNPIPPDNQNSDDYTNFRKLETMLLKPGVEHEANSTPLEPRALFAGDLSQWSQAVRSSELLYLIVANSQYAGSPALENFRASEIGDPDEDGLLEFIDAWGNAIHWMRWPAGYPSDLNRYSGTDAMDPLRTDWRYSNNAWPEQNKPQTIVPLIMSSGDDGEYGITTGFAFGNGQQVPIIVARMRQGFGSGRFYVDPFFTWDYQSNPPLPNGPNSVQPYPDDPVNFPLGYRANQLGSIPKFTDSSGTEENTFATDNITNHDIILGL